MTEPTDETISLELTASEYKLLTLFAAVDDESPDMWIRRTLSDMYAARLNAATGEEGLRPDYWNVISRRVKKELGA